MESNSQNKSIRAYNNEERAQQYDTIGGFDPKRKELMLDVSSSLLDELMPLGASVLELGSGSGLYTKKIIHSNKVDRIFVTDGAEVMLNIAKRNVYSERILLEFETLDFTDTGWSRRFHDRTINAVTSSMAIHHAEDKQALFTEIYSALAEDGVLVLSDHMGGSSNRLEHLIGLKRAKLKLAKQGINSPDTDQVNAFIEADREKQLSEGNKCESVQAYLTYLSDAGFKEVDCMWRDYWLAVFVAIK